MPTDILITAPVQKSRYQVSQFYTNVRARLALTGSNRISDAQILTFLNEGQDELAQETHWYRTSSSITPTAGTKEYDLPTGLIALEEVWWNPSSRQLWPMTPEGLDSLYAVSGSWRYASNGTPTYYYVNVNSALGLHPTPDVSTASAIFLVYSKLPAQATGSSDYLYHPAGHEKTIINYACWMASVRDAPGEGSKRADTFRAAYVEGLNKLKRQVEALYGENMTVMGEYGTPRGGRGFPRSDWEDGTAIPAPA